MATTTTPATRRARVEVLATTLYAEQRSHLLRVANRHAFNADDAEEALNEAFIAFIGKFDPDGEPHPVAWLTLVLKRECWQRRRSHHLDRRYGQEATLDQDEVGSVLDWIPDPGRSPQDQAELSDRVAEARNQLAELKPDERRALALKALGYSYKEIGEITGWTYTKINRCIAEGRSHLRRLA